MTKDSAESPWVPPHDLDAEGAILSGLLNREVGLDAFPFLRPEHFYSALNGLIFGTIAAAMVSGTPWDSVSVLGTLKDQGARAPDGSVSTYLVETLGMGQPAVVPSTATVHAQRVFRLWKWRNARMLVGMAYAALRDRDPAEVLAGLDEELRVCGFRFGVLDTDAGVRPANETHAGARDSGGNGARLLQVLPRPAAGQTPAQASRQPENAPPEAVRTRPAARAVQALTPARPASAPAPNPRSAPFRRGTPSGTSNRAE